MPEDSTTDSAGGPPERVPLDTALVHAHLPAGPTGLWHTVRVLAQTGSTNADVAALAAGGEPEGLVTVAEFQRDGRGRFARQWVSPPRAGLTWSMLLRPVDVPVDRWGWLPLLVGTAVATALAEAAQVDVALKWPNDLLAGPHRHKLGGLLAEVVGDAVVVGVGVNVTTTRAELPIAEATSLELEGAWTVDRASLLVHVLEQVERDYRAWREHGGDPEASGLLGRYRSLSATIGQEVAVSLPGGSVLTGVATDVAESGALLVDGPAGPVLVAAGDVEHVRGAE